jgi:hypothetical protein
MAGFKTHIATSTVLGIGYGATAHVGYGVPAGPCLLAAGLCSVSGMLPDLDSDNSVPVRETLAFAGAAVPMLVLNRFQDTWTTDALVLTAAILYVLIRFGFGAFLKSYTRHRGMFHSLPAAIIFAELAYLACDCPENSTRLLKAGAVLLGFMSHLVLDELWAVDWRNGCRLKSSFGTALKLWDKVWWANISAYAKLILVTWVLLNEPALMPPGHGHAPQMADQPPPPPPTQRAETPPLRPFR